jgi:putative ABC transport system substrate-binding protein
VVDRQWFKGYVRFKGYGGVIPRRDTGGQRHGTIARERSRRKRPTVSILLTNASIDAWSAAFTERLRELGWTAGHTVAIDYRWWEGRPERIAEIAVELAQQKVDVIVTYGAAVAALKQATASIPIVLIANDPVGSGLVASLSRPGGNQMQMERFNG